MILTSIINSAGKIIKSREPIGNCGENKWLLSNVDNRKYISKFSEYGINPNNYGYQDKVREYTLTRSGIIAYNKISNKPLKKKKIVSDKDRIDQWSRRLARLCEDVTIEEAHNIANAKIDYKLLKIEAMEDRQFDSFSIKRNKLINKMKREDPLRRIIDAEHAKAVVAAYRRHEYTNYDNMLEYAHGLEKYGDIEKGEAREYARKNIIN